MILGFGNNVTAKLTSDITSLQTELPVDIGSGSLFAKLLTTDMSNEDTSHKIFAKVTLTNLQSSVSEICHLTAVNGDTLTVIRGQEGTVSRGWKLGDVVANFATRGSENTFVQIEQLQGGDYAYATALGTANNLVVNIPSTYTNDSWDLKTPIVITPIYNNSGSVTIQLILGGMVIGTFPIYKDNNSQLVRNDIIAGIPFIVLLDKTKTFFNIINGNYLSLTGGEISGSLTVNNRLAVRNDQNSDLTLEKQSGDKSGYTIRMKGDDLFIYKSKNGITADNYIAQYKKANDTWDFNVSNVTNNGKTIIPPSTIKEEYWIPEETKTVKKGDIYKIYNKYAGQAVELIPQVYIPKEESKDGNPVWVDIGFQESGHGIFGISLVQAVDMSDPNNPKHFVGIEVAASGSTSHVIPTYSEFNIVGLGPFYPKNPIDNDVAFRIRVVRYYSI